MADDIKISIALQDVYLTGIETIGKEIGVGAYGKVFEVECFGTICAAKQIHPILVNGVSPEEFKTVKRRFCEECIRSVLLSHKNIVQFLGVCNLPSCGGQSPLPILVMERMQGSLTSVVKTYPNIPMYVKLSMLLDVSQGLWYLHGHHPSIVHRDLSPNNVLLTSQFVAKISDLGEAKVIQADSKKTKTRAPGTVDFMPPETLLETPEYGPPLDVFSYGGIIVHVVNQEWPTPSHYVQTVLENGMSRKISLSEVERRERHIKKMTGIPIDLLALVEQCLEDDPSRRPAISDMSERMKRMKEVESVRCPQVNTNPITWQQVEQTTKVQREATVTAPTANAEHPVADSQDGTIKKTLKWKKLAPLPVGRSQHTVVVLDGAVYIGGGCEGISLDDDRLSYRLDVYNLTTNQWSSSPITTPYSWFAMTVLEGKLITAGGVTKNNEVVKDILILNAGQWKDFSKMPTDRYCATAVGYHSVLIVVGGIGFMENKWTKITTTELFCATNRCWYRCNNLPSPCQLLKSAIMNNHLYLLSGGDKNNIPSQQVFVASLQTLLNSTNLHLKWQSLSNTNWCFSAPVAHNNSLLSIGGTKKGVQTSEMCALNPKEKQWELYANIPEEVYHLAVVGLDNNILIIGGITTTDEYSNKVWISMF